MYPKNYNNISLSIEQNYEEKNYEFTK